MGNNVFGDAITDKNIGDIGIPIIPLFRARLAYYLMNEGGKSEKALNYVKNLKAQYGNGIACLVLVYNATGDAVDFVTSNDWHGHIWEKSSYPTHLENGQWGAFLHVHPSELAAGSAAGIVYRGKNNAREEYDYMCSWSIPLAGENKSYTMNRRVGHFTGAAEWDALHKLTEHARDTASDEWNGCVSKVSIGVGPSPVYKAILTLKSVEN